MQTIQHPFFLSSAQGSNRSADGSSFSVRLNPPLRIPREALHTRVYCNQASCVYSFPNVTATDNAVHLSVKDASTGVATRYDLTVPPGLYGGLEDIQAALAQSAVEQGVPGVTDATTFGHFMQLTANEATSRVTLNLTTQDWSVLLDPDGDGDDLLLGLLGFATSQATHSRLFVPASKGWSVTVTPVDLSQVSMMPFGYREIFGLAWGNSGQAYIELAYSGHPMHYTMDQLVAKINEHLAFGPHQGSDYSRGVIYKEQSDRGLFDNLRVASITPDLAAYQASGTLTLNTQLTGAPASGNGSDVALWGLGDTEHFAWQHNTDGIATGYEAAGPGTFDKVRALQIACPGLATGVHVNDEVGSATIARFPINTSPGGLIQFDPINPIKSSRDLSGTSLSTFRVELLDQLGQPVDTRGESFNAVIIIEYDLPGGSKVAGSFT